MDDPFPELQAFAQELDPWVDPDLTQSKWVMSSLGPPSGRSGPGPKNVGPVYSNRVPGLARPTTHPLEFTPLDKTLKKLLL